MEPLGNDDERRPEAEWIERQRSGWGTPGRWAESFLGPVSFRVGMLIIVLGFLAFLVLGFLIDSPMSEAEAVERVVTAPIHGASGADELAYGELMRRFTQQHGLAGGEWRIGERLAWDGGYRVVWHPPSGSGLRPIGFQVTGERHARVRVERQTLAEAEKVVRAVLGGEAAARFLRLRQSRNPSYTLEDHRRRSLSHPPGGVASYRRHWWSGRPRLRQRPRPRRRLARNPSSTSTPPPSSDGDTGFPPAASVWINPVRVGEANAG